VSPAQDDDPIREVENLVQSVRDEDDARALCGHPAHGIEQSPDLAAGKRDGGLVKHQQVVVGEPSGQGSGNRQDPLLSRGQGRHSSSDVEYFSEAGDERLGLPSLAPLPYWRKRPQSGPASEAEVLDRAQAGDQTQVLVDEVEVLESVRTDEQVPALVEHLHGP